jgi:hypothetical protein
MTAVWAGIDSGMRAHHCAVIDAEGRMVLSRRVANDETDARLQPATMRTCYLAPLSTLKNARHHEPSTNANAPKGSTPLTAGRPAAHLGPPQRRHPAC